LSALACGSGEDRTEICPHPHPIERPVALEPRGEAGPGAAGRAFAASCEADDPFIQERGACSFATGARVSQTLGDTRGLRQAIGNVIVIVQENHSLDNLFGKTGHGIDGLPDGVTVPDRSGGRVAPFHLQQLCVADMPHGYNAIHQEYDDGQMDGFVRVGGRNVMGYYEDSDHPFYTWAATHFAFSDRYFSSVLGPTWPNRDYLFAGTSDGIRETGERALEVPNLFDELDAALIPWANYNNGTHPPLETDLGWAPCMPQIKPFDELAGALAAGMLEPVVFVDTGEGVNDEHPGESGIDRGERLVAQIVEQAFESPLWPRLALFMTYDEGGGFYDHVPPPPACRAAPSEVDFDRLGMRVPLTLISPYARTGYVSHQVHSHTSMLRFIQALFDLPALSARDANSDALLDLFDFCKAPDLPPVDITAPTTVVSHCP
jgi:phospholipase C